MLATLSPRSIKLGSVSQWCGLTRTASMVTRSVGAKLRVGMQRLNFTITK
jgi:hypothetical protein